MRAITCTRYGPPDVLQLKEAEKPVPGENDVLIKIHATTVTMGDCEMRSFKIPLLFWLPLRLVMGFRKPKLILGQEFSGKIEAIGKNVTNFKQGDAVFAPTDMKLGAYAEYIRLSASHPIARKPENLSFEQAACIPTGGLNALYFFRRADIQPGEKVLVVGAGGSIGTYFMQLAKSNGAEVTGIDSAEKLDMLRSLGANYVMDYTKEDFTKSSKTYDVIFLIAGKYSVSGCVRALSPNGRLLMGNFSLTNVFKGIGVSMFSSKKIINGVAGYKTEDLNHLANLTSNGQLNPVIDKIFSLEQMAEAHRYVESGHKKGNVVIKVVK